MPEHRFAMLILVHASLLQHSLMTAMVKKAVYKELQQFKALYVCHIVLCHVSCTSCACGLTGQVWLSRGTR